MSLGNSRFISVMRFSIPLILLLSFFLAPVVYAAPPKANSDSYSTLEDTILNISAPGVLANDTDPGRKTLTAVLLRAPIHGALVLNADGSFSFTPALNYFGADSFTYHATNGSENSNTATVNINITAVNDVPVANDVPTL